MKFRNFENKNEEQLATDIIATIDQGEKWIFQGAEGCTDFGGFIDRLFYCNGDTYGTYCASIYCGQLRLQIGFNTDIPTEVCEELLLLITKARSQVNTFTSVWYPPDNKRLDEFIFSQLPWKAQGHKTHELTFKGGEIYQHIDFPKNVYITPFVDEYLDATCSLLDNSLAHTFDNPNSSMFLNNKGEYLVDWKEKAKNDDCCVLFENDELVGVYIVKDAEIDLMAIAEEKQGKGYGRLLLHHAREHISSTRIDDPFLYCIDRNADALQFYLREGMKITGYSGYAYFEANRGEVPLPY